MSLDVTKTLSVTYVDAGKTVYRIACSLREGLSKYETESRFAGDSSLLTASAMQVLHALNELNPSV